MLNELYHLLKGYLAGHYGIAAMAGWLGSVDWNYISTEEGETIGTFELLATEVLEGLRPEADFRTEAEYFTATWSTGETADSTTWSESWT